VKLERANGTVEPHRCVASMHVAVYLLQRPHDNANVARTRRGASARRLRDSDVGRQSNLRARPPRRRDYT